MGRTLPEKTKGNDMSKKTEGEASRRDFLKLAGTAAPAAAVAVAAGFRPNKAGPLQAVRWYMQDAYKYLTRYGIYKHSNVYGCIIDTLYDCVRVR